MTSCPHLQAGVLEMIPPSPNANGAKTHHIFSAISLLNCGKTNVGTIFNSDFAKSFAYELRSVSHQLKEVGQESSSAANARIEGFAGLAYVYYSRDGRFRTKCP